jgi:hypothetical protein
VIENPAGTSDDTPESLNGRACCVSLENARGRRSLMRGAPRGWSFGAFDDLAEGDIRLTRTH